MNCKKCLLSTLRQYVNNTQNDWNYITPIQFYESYFKPNLDNYFLLDLRRKEDFDKFHIKNAVNIFWLDLLKEENLRILPRNKHIFLICYVGHTSSQAMVILRLLGYKVTSIKYGYGLSPDSKIPVAGWLNYKLPIVKYI
jgi:rhodanese-related sulfurtransferase